jgi:4-amino-4-deoxychorismate lyase
MPFNLITNLETNAGADVGDRGLHYGDGLFETLFLDQNGIIRFWQEHYQRLSLSARRLNIECPDQDWFFQRLQPFTAKHEKLVIKIILTRGSKGRGLSIPSDMTPNVYLLQYPADELALNQTVKCFFSSIVLPDNPNLRGMKHLNRLDYVLATQELQLHPQYDEAILCSPEGNVVESIVNNLFFIRSDQIYTPDLSNSGVPGIMRDRILKHLKRAGKNVNIGDYSQSDILGTDECFICNSVQGIRPVIKLQERELAVGPITRKLQQEIHGV